MIGAFNYDIIKNKSNKYPVGSISALKILNKNLQILFIITK